MGSWFLVAVTSPATPAFADATAARDAARFLACSATEFGLLLFARSPIPSLVAAAAGIVLT